MARVGAVVGHGIKPDGTYDPGASGGGTTEQEAGDVVTKAYVDELRRHDVVVPVNEAYADDPNYVGTVETCNEKEVDVAVSFHHDWSGAPQGFFCHWYPGSEEGEKLANLFWHEVAAAGYAGRDDWHKPRNLYFTRETEMPAVLVELGRIGQYTDAQLKELGHHIAHATLDYFDIDTAPSYDKDVAVIWHDGKDLASASGLGDEFMFWVDKAPNPSKSIKYAVLVGAAQEFEDHFPASTKIYGKTAAGTGVAVKEALKDVLDEDNRPDDFREAPWSDGYYVPE